MKTTVTKQRRKRFDELHRLGAELSVSGEEEYNKLPPEEKRRRKERFWDCLWDWLIDGWAAGLLFVGEDKDIPDLTHILNHVYPREVTTSDLYNKDISNPEAFQRFLEAEANRCFNEGVIEAGRGTRGLLKTWETMEDEKVRDSHWILQSETIPFDEEFVTFGGDSALAPGMFQEANNNVACRCWLSLKKPNNNG